MELSSHHFVFLFSVWEDPKFIAPDIPNNPGHVTLICNADNACKATFDEEVNVTLYIAKLSYNGDSTIYVKEVDTNLLKPDIIKDNESNYIITNMPQDYETNGDKSIKLHVTIDALDDYLYLSLRDINDMKPILNMEDQVCQYEENTNGSTACIIQLSDGDTTACTDTKVEVFDAQNTSESGTFSLRLDKVVNCNKDFTLIVEKNLDYETKTLYKLDVNVTDDPYHTSKRLVLEVQDMPDMPPVWNMITTKTLMEGEENSITLYARDGDIGLDEKLNYSIQVDADNQKYFELDPDSGELKIKAIDRETIKNNMISITATAYDSNSNSDTNLTFIVTDINDNSPEIVPCNLIMRFDEGAIYTLNNINITDPDENQNGMYNVFLEDLPGKHFTENFKVIPDQGYQTATFSITVVKPKNLDYEKDPDFKFQFVAKELANTSHIKICEVNVHLNDIFDETPVFQNLEPANVTEKAPDGTLITTLHAIDDDLGDVLTYSTTSTSVLVDQLTGKVTAIEGMFDHEIQTQMIIQVKVQDKGNNSVSDQFILNILDQNDTPPNIYMPIDNVIVKETSEVGYVVTDGIRANDLDENADLLFDINWEGSSATQQGLKKNLSDFIDTFAINPGCNCNTDKYKACCCLEVAKELDWKNMDILYLNITVTDNNTEVNANSSNALLVISITDEDNHAPEFQPIGDLLVVENSTTGASVGSVRAIDDKDGLGNNEVVYMLEPIKDTPPGLVQIDKNGILTVDENKKIDYEVHKELYYTVTASDKSHSPQKNITIKVVDINDNKPKINITIQPDPIPEDTKSGIVYKVTAHDDDCSSIYNTLAYTFDPKFSLASNSLFSIDEETGIITVDLKNPDDELDYETAQSYDIWVLVQDNLLIPNSTDFLTDLTKVTIPILDVNDNPPVFTVPAKCEAQPQEDTAKNAFITQIQANDGDTKPEYKTVLYNITNIISVTAVKEPPTDLFLIDERSGNIRAGRDLRGYIGNYNITVMGRNPDTITPQSSMQEFTICVQDINDHSPVINFPENGGKIILLEQQRPGEALEQYKRGTLPPISATDEDMGKNAEIDFQILDKGTGPTKDYFKIEFIDTKSALLTLKQSFHIDKFREFQMSSRPGGNMIYIETHFDSLRFVTTSLHVVINATDRGTPTVPQFIDVTIQVVTYDHPPTFNDNTDKTSFKENDDNAAYQIPEAIDIDNMYKDPEDLEEIIYKIENDYDENKFYLDGAVVKLHEPLDYEEQPEYTLEISAKNPDGTQVDASVLTLTIEVEDENDCFPEFDKESYAEGIGTGDKPGKLIKRFNATDKDKGDVVTYKLLTENMTASDSSLKPHLGDLELNAGGELTLHFSPDNTMSGYFSFQISATDAVSHVSVADVRVYIISDANRQSLLFENHKSFVDEMISKIEEVLTTFLGYDCTVEQTLIQNLNTTSVTTHFINENMSLPVENSVINLLLDEKKVELRAEFKQFALNWGDFNLQDKTTDKGSDQSGLTQIVLIVVSALLATLVLLLLATFFFKIRSYNRRLEALSQTKFGSQDSGLNRVNMNVPNTNQHALEGSNPVWNEELSNDDNISQGSGDSELVGVEDNPEFRPQDHGGESRRGSKNPIFENMGNEKEWSSFDYSPDINMNDEKNPNFSFGPPQSNVPITEL